jgi:RNA polymerase sigma-70 factor (ECF subfamily)
MTQTPDLEVLLIKARSGDTGALAAILEACAPQVRARIEGRISPQLRSSLDVDDVLQVTFIEVVTRIGRFTSGGVNGFVAWVIRLAENNLIDAIRSLEAAKRPDPSRRVDRVGSGMYESMVALVDMLSGTLTTASQHVARSEAVELLEAALKSLPRDYERVVRMYDLEGRPVEEVAAALGRSEGAIFMLRARAHERLREAMGPAERFFSDPG